MAPNSLVVLAALLVVIVAAGQGPRGAALGASTSINSSVLVSGMVPCAAGNSINAATAPVFPNAGLQLVCGSKVVATTTADGNGAFLFSLVSVDQNQLAALLSNQCKVVVVTPLGACDKSLAAATGTLTAPLKLLGINTGSGGTLDLGGIISLIGQIIGGLIGGLIGGILNLGTQSFSLV